MGKRVVQVLLDEPEFEELKEVQEEDASSESAAGRKLIRLGLQARKE